MMQVCIAELVGEDLRGFSQRSTDVTFRLRHAGLAVFGDSASPVISVGRTIAKTYSVICLPMVSTLFNAS